jgi:hypothetical protein
MMILVLTALVVTAMTLVIHGFGTSWWLHRLGRRYSGVSQRPELPAKTMVIIQTALGMIVLHFVEIFLWAIAYMLVAVDELQSLESAVYFSAVTFTTLGYGDITLSSNWRLLSGFEAINGIVLIGWTTAFLYAILQRMWEARASTTGGTHE